MYDHLAADKYKVDIKQEYLRPKAIKAFRKTSRFPAWELYEYKIPATNNQYIIYFYAETRTRAEYPEVGSFCIVYADKHRFVVQWGASGYKHTPDSKIVSATQISHIFLAFTNSKRRRQPWHIATSTLTSASAKGSDVYSIKYFWVPGKLNIVIMR